MKKTGPYHGGNLKAAERLFGAPAKGWLDLSTGINPWPYPVAVLPSSAWSRLPDEGDVQGLLAAARGYYGLGDEAGLVAAPGTQALLQALPQVLSPQKVAVVSPTYGEHAHSWAAAGHEVTETPTLSEAVSMGEVVVIVEPNNPDGRISGKKKLKETAREMAAKGGLLIVDGAFADVAPEADVANLAGMPGLLLLRSFGKFFGLAGVRLGFAAGEKPLIETLAARLGPWAVSGPAIALGERAFQDRSWIEATRNRLSEAGRSLCRLLESRGFDLVGGTDLFVLVETPKAGQVFEHLGRDGILVRPFEERPHRLRFGLPGGQDEWDRLTRSLMGAPL